MKIIPLSGVTQARTGFTHKININHTDVNTVAALTEVIQVFPYDPAPLAPTITVPAGWVVTDCAVRLVTAFANSAGGADLLTCKIEVGDGADPNRYLLSTELLGVATEVDFFHSGAGASATPTMPYAYLAADGIDALFTVTRTANDDLADLTAGEVDVYLSMYDMRDLADPK
jgi:hypothetical protein